MAGEDTDATIVIGLELDDGTLRKVKLNVDELGEKLGDSLGKRVSGGIDKSFTGIAVQLEFVAKIAAKAFSIVSGVVKEAVGEAIQAEQALALFNATLANSGKFSQAASADFVEFASNLQRVGTVSDDAVISAATNLISIGKLTGENLKTATQASVDLAAGLQMDLGTAFDLVAKAAAGNTAALARYGLKVDESIPKGERFSAILKLIEERFGGLDVQKANTFGGALTQLSNNFSDVLENVGKLFTQSPALVAVFRFISDGVRGVAERIGEVGKQGDVLRPIIAQFIDLARVLTQNVVPAFEMILNIGKFVFNAILTGISALGTAFSGLAAGIANTINALSRGLVISDETAAGIRKNFEANQATLTSLADSTRESFTAIKDDFSITEAADSFLADLQTVATNAPPILEQLRAGGTKSFGDLATGFRLTAEQLGKAVRDALANSISQGVQVIVSNLARGKNAFDGFAKAVLGIIGDMAIQIGTTLIGVGLGIEALKASLLTLSGGQAIAAGIALVAIGALLKSLSGGGGESTTTTAAAGPGGVPGSPSLDGGLNGQPELDRNRETKVAINIQGNVLDRKETGLEIASVLQEFFDTQDGVLVRG